MAEKPEWFDDAKIASIPISLLEDPDVLKKKLENV